jgi:hypothetical protein
MIVSDGLGVSKLAQPRKKRNFKAVQRAVPDSSIVSETPRQVPNFCISKHMAKPFLVPNDAPKYKMGYVPLKSLQECSHEEGVSLFNAPIMLIPTPLKVVVPKKSEINYDEMLAEVQVPFEMEFDYKKGIRPSMRRLKGDAVEEPDAPFPTRVGRAATARPVFGTYDLGALAINQLAK